MISIFTHVIKPVRDTHSEPGLPLFLHWQQARIQDFLMDLADTVGHQTIR